MNFEQFWSKLSKEKKDIRLETSARKQGFTFSFDDKFNEVVVVPESTNIPRHILRNDFHNVWNKFKEINGDPYRPAFYQRVTHNASYILTIMNHLLKGDKVS